MKFLLTLLGFAAANSGVPTESTLIKAVVNDTESTPPKPCLRAEFTASFTAANEDKINLSDNIDIEGSSCDKLKMLDLTSNYTLIMQFKNNENLTWVLDGVEVQKPDGTSYKNGTVNEVSAPLDTKWGQSFLCTKGFDINLDPESKLTLGRIQIQPFKVPEDTYANPIICAQDINTVIPAVVGSILALLVVLVLVTYVIGRRRTRIAYQEI